MGSYKARLMAVALALLSAALLAAGCTHAVGSRVPASVRVSFCGGALAPAPPVVNVDCLNNSIMARRLRWSGWGGPIATATGSATVDLCAYEDCASGDYVTVPIVLITSKIRHCPGRSVRAYSRLQYVFVDRSPFAGLPAGISVPDGSNSPVDPRNQTVSLTC